MLHALQLSFTFSDSLTPPTHLSFVIPPCPPHPPLFRLHLLLQGEGVLEVRQPEADGGARIPEVHPARLDGLRSVGHGALWQQREPRRPPSAARRRGHHGDHQRRPDDGQRHRRRDPVHPVAVHPGAGVHHISVQKQRSAAEHHYAALLQIPCSGVGMTGNTALKRSWIKDDGWLANVGFRPGSLATKTMESQR